MIRLTSTLLFSAPKKDMLEYSDCISVAEELLAPRLLLRSGLAACEIVGIIKIINKINTPNNSFVFSVLKIFSFTQDIV